MDRLLHMHLRPGLLLIAALLPPAAAAAEANMTAPSPAPGVPDVLSVAVSLVLVVAAILLVGWLYARVQRIRGGGAGDIRVLAAQALGTKERIVVVQIAGKQLVVGVTPSCITTLHAFDGQLVADRDARPAKPASFAARLRAALASRPS